MRHTASLVIFILAGCLKPANSADKNGNSGIETKTEIQFRSAKWGMTPDEVKAVETVKLITSDAGGLESWEHIDLAGNQCKIQYEFTKNRLFLGVYYCLIDNTISSKSYDTIRADLARQWGKLPNVNANRWVNGRCSITIDARKIDTLDQTMITVSYMEE